MPGRPRRPEAGGRSAARAVVALAALSTLFAGCSGEPERSVANYCAQASVLTTLSSDLASGDPVRIDARLEDLRLLQQVAPPEIEPSVAVLTGITGDFSRTAGTATDRTKVAEEAFRGRSTEIDAIEGASRSVADFTLANCQLDVAGRGSTVPGTGPGGAPGGSSGPVTGSPSTAADGPTSTTTSTPSLLVD